MSTSPDGKPAGTDDPTEELRATTSPHVTTAPATTRRRIWPRSVPNRIGRARTSTVVLAALFVIAGLLFVPPVATDPASGSSSGTPARNESPVTTRPGTPTPTPTPAPASTSEVPPSSTPSEPSSTPRTPTPSAQTTVPQDTGSSSATTSQAPDTTTTTTPATTTRAPAAAPTTSEPAAPTN